MNPDPRFYRLVGALQPQHINDLIVVQIILENMRGERKEERIVFNDMTSAWEFFITQKKMLKIK